MPGPLRTLLITLNEAPQHAKPRGPFRALRVTALVVTAGVVIVLFGALLFSGPAAVGERNQARGDQIIAALERYKVANGSYPAALKALVPQFLESIPQPEDAEWVYLPDASRAEFGLF